MFREFFKRDMAESSSVTPKWTCLTSQNKALLYLQALLGKHSGQLINTSLVERSMENILCRATISDFQTWISDFSNWSGKVWVQGCSESEEREDIHGESSICAWGELSLLDRLQEHKCVQSHLRLEHEFSTAESQIAAAPGSYLGSGRDPAGQHCTAQPAFPSQHILQLESWGKKELLPKSHIERIQLDSINNIPGLNTNYQLTPAKIRRASARFDWSQGQSCFIFWMDCSHQSSPGWIASSQAVLSLLSWATSCPSSHLYFCINNNKGQNW